MSNLLKVYDTSSQELMEQETDKIVKVLDNTTINQPFGFMKSVFNRVLLEYKSEAFALAAVYQAGRIAGVKSERERRRLKAVKTSSRGYRL